MINVVKYSVNVHILMQNFIKQNAAIHDLSYNTEKKTCRI